jgi:hypothetical protein
MREEHVTFVAKPGVTIYTGGSPVGYPPGTSIRMPQDYADALEHVRDVPAPAIAEQSAAQLMPQPEPAPKVQELDVAQAAGAALVVDAKKTMAPPKP